MDPHAFAAMAWIELAHLQFTEAETRETGAHTFDYRLDCDVIEQFWTRRIGGEKADTNQSARAGNAAGRVEPKDDSVSSSPDEGIARLLRPNPFALRSLRRTFLGMMEAQGCQSKERRPAPVAG